MTFDQFSLKNDKCAPLCILHPKRLVWREQTPRQSLHFFDKWRLANQLHVSDLKSADFQLIASSVLKKRRSAGSKMSSLILLIMSIHLAPHWLTRAVELLLSKQISGVPLSWLNLELCCFAPPMMITLKLRGALITPQPSITTNFPFMHYWEQQILDPMLLQLPPGKRSNASSNPLLIVSLFSQFSIITKLR